MRSLTAWFGDLVATVLEGIKSLTEMANPERWKKLMVGLQMFDGKRIKLHFDGRSSGKEKTLKHVHTCTHVCKLKNVGIIYLFIYF